MIFVPFRSGRVRDQCSPAVLRAVAAASGESGRAAPLAYLAALTEDEDGRASVLLARHGLERSALRDLLANGKDERTEAEADRLLADARALARERDTEGDITSEFFLLALLRSGGLGERLAELGLDLAGLEREVLGEPAPIPAPVEGVRLADVTDRTAAARVLDVNANRTREALRVLDDYCRFVLDDATLTEEVKRQRHELVALFALLPANLFLAARETEGDVGTVISTPAEMERDSPREVARVNLKRLQEALRSLEEFGKTVSATFAVGIEQLRYRTYTLEKAVLIGDAGRQILADARLYVLLTGAQCAAALDWTIAEAAAGGASIFQLREKTLGDRALLARAREVRRWTRQAGALFIVNDRPDIARLSDADGVHLGQDDMPVSDARKIVGPDALIGVSTHDLDQLRSAVLDGASYVGVGPTFPSATKVFPELAGLAFVREALAATSLPAFVIGGITPETVGAAVNAGARRAAVSAAVARADDPRLAARVLCEALSKS
jgi:thiamine-phosphate pyrophosphorylase